MSPSERAGGRATPAPPAEFPAEALAFFDGLEEDNSKAYFDAHRDQFRRCVQEPMAALLESLAEPIGTFRVFRMNRDVRFSADKSPYKTAHAAIHDDRGSVHYLHVDGGGLMAACGAYLMSPGQLERYRRAVAEPRPGRQLERILSGLAAAGLDIGGGLEPLKTAPRGYPRDHPRIDLLRRRGVVASAGLPGPALVDGDRVRAFALETYQATAPLHRWLQSHVGVDPSDDVTVTPTGRRHRH